MAFTLGMDLQALTLLLTRGADFTATLQNADTPWPDDATIELRFGTDPQEPDHTWAATLVEDLATFSIDKAAVDTVIASHPRKVTLWYLEGTADLCWAAGTVIAK